MPYKYRPVRQRRVLVFGSEMLACTALSTFSVQCRYRYIQHDILNLNSNSPYAKTFVTAQACLCEAGSCSSRRSNPVHQEAASAKTKNASQRHNYK